MSNQETIINISDVSGSGGPNETLITASFTGSTGVVYGCRVNGIPTSSFNPAPYIEYYRTDNYTGSISVVRSGAYPVFPGNVHNISTQNNDKAFEIVSNTGSTNPSLPQILEVYPTLEDFSLNEIPFIQPFDSGSYTSFNFNAQDVRINFTSSNPNYTGDNNFKAILTNWPQYQREQLSDSRTNDNLAINGENRFRGVSENDLGIVSWFNISGSINSLGVTGREYAVNLYYFSPLSSSLETGEINASASFTGPVLDGLSSALVISGSGSDIQYCSGPLFPANFPGLNPNLEWNSLLLCLNKG